MNIWKAEDEIIEMARELILAHRPELQDAHIVYLFREKAGKKGAKLILGTARKCTEREQLVHTPQGYPAVQFVIELAADTWSALSEAQRKAVLHHEINHCGFDKKEDGSLVPVILPHDVEEFSSIIQTHGLYMRDIEQFAASVVAASANTSPGSGAGNEESPA